MKRILVVDDQAGMRFLFRKMFADQKKFELKEAGTAEEGHKIFKEFQPDLLLLDVALPDKDARYLLDDLKDEPQLKKCKLVLMSGIAEKEETLLLSRAKVDLFLSKPFDIEKTAEQLFGLLGESVA